MAKTLVDWLPELLDGKAVISPDRRMFEEVMNAQVGEEFMDKVYIVADKTGFFLERQFQEDNGEWYAEFETFSPSPAELLSSSYILAANYVR